MKGTMTVRRRAMADYYRFSIFNVISFTFLAGNIIILYALRLGAPSVLVGLIGAAYQVTFVFSLIGRRLIERLGAVRLFGYFWLIRYLLMVPVIFTVLPFFRERSWLALLVVTVGAFAFNIAKGIGITATKPIVGEIPPQRERGRFLSNHHLIIQLGAIATGVTMALLLGQESPIWRYAILLSVGITAGVFAAYFILKLPEPQEATEGFTANFRDGLRRAFEPGPFRRINAINALSVFVVSMVQAFLVVYFKRVYQYPDQTVVFFTVAGAVGGAAMALISRSFLDRLGSKPLLFAFLAVLLAILIPVALSPRLSGIWLWLFPALVYFCFVMGHSGLMNVADNYFFSISAPEDRLDLGIVFGLGSGIAGSAGAFLGGVLLSGFESAFPGQIELQFGLYFGIAALILLVALLRIIRLPDQGAYPIPDAIGMLFSPRDIRATRLLNRLRRSKTAGEEQAAVEALRSSTSRLSVSEIAAKISSPSLFVRMEAISSLRDSPLTPQVEDLLMSHVRSHQFTTAHLAAEALGLARVNRALPVLRDAIFSSDYMTVAKALVALARIGDRESIPEIEQIFVAASNPRVAVYAAKALEELDHTPALKPLLHRLAGRCEESVCDELLLSATGLLHMSEFFYPLYGELRESPTEAYRSLNDFVKQPGGANRVLPHYQRAASAFTLLESDAQRALRELALILQEMEWEVNGFPVSEQLLSLCHRRGTAHHRRLVFLCAAAVAFRLQRA
jgi:MFS family permease